MRPRIHGRLPGERSTFPAGRVPTLTLTELRQLHVAQRLHLRGPLREHSEQLGRDAGDLGLAMHDRSPHDAELVEHLGPQRGLVEAAEHPVDAA